MIDWYQHLPLHINPIAFSIGFFSIRWYGIMYLIGFLVVYGLLRLRILKDEFPVSISNDKFPISNKNSNLLVDYLMTMFVVALIGGRLGYVLFYNLQYYIANPLTIISPYDFRSGQYVGIFGMSYHGALLAIIVGSYLFLKKRNIRFLSWADFIIPAVALGYFFGRVGNFLNAELYGRITTSSLGMYFSADPIHLRHPSQLYEAFLEGILLFVVLWKIRNKNFKAGTLFGIYLFGYGILRIIVENFREPDAQIGLLWNYFTIGQLLSVGVLLGGVFLLLWKNEK